MIILANLLSAIGQCLDIALTFVLIVVIAHAILSWVSPDPNNAIVRFINSVTDPMLRPIQRRVPMFGRIDISPILLLIAIFFLKAFVVQTMLDYSHVIRVRQLTSSATQAL